MLSEEQGAFRGRGGLIPGLWNHDTSQRQALNQATHTGTPKVVLSKLFFSGIS